MPCSSPQRHSGSPARIRRWQLLSAMGSDSAPEYPGRANTATFMLHNFQDPIAHSLYRYCIWCNWDQVYICMPIATETSSFSTLKISCQPNYSVESHVSSLRKILPGRRLSLPHFCVHCRLRTYPKIITDFTLLLVGQLMPILFILLLLITLKQSIYRKCSYSIIVPDLNCAVLYRLTPALLPFSRAPRASIPLSDFFPTATAASHIVVLPLSSNLRYLSNSTNMVIIRQREE